MTIDKRVEAAKALGCGEKTMAALRSEKRRYSKAAVIELLRQGYSATSAAVATGLSRGTVASIARRQSIKLKCGRPAGTSQYQPGERERAMVAAYQAGKTLEEIGAEYGITRERVRQLINKTAGRVYGGERLKAEQRKAARAQADFERMLAKKERLDAIRAAYVAGEHLQQIARKFGFGSPQHLNNWLRRKGIPARSTRGRHSRKKAA